MKYSTKDDLGCHVLYVLITLWYAPLNQDQLWGLNQISNVHNQLGKLK